jgi:hypothetical protein
MGKLYGIEASLKGKTAEEKYLVRQEKSSSINFMIGLSTIKIKFPRKANLEKRLLIAVTKRIS